MNNTKFFTRNYDNIITMTRLPFGSKSFSEYSDKFRYSFGTEFKDGNLTIKNAAGTIYSDIYGNKRSTNNYENPTYVKGPFEIFGFDINPSQHTKMGTTVLALGKGGSQVATYDDFNMATPINLTNSIVTDRKDMVAFTDPVVSELVYDSLSHTFNKTIIYLITACGDVTISEIGFFYSNGNAIFLPSIKGILLYRETFDPIVLAQNENLELKFTMSIPANPNNQPTINTETAVIK